ncbi:VWA domain-containing protein [Streptomyces sp. NPDC001851]|uniref:VWA domain-containing protein n=1 Tax=Streptomyces sp. NPDC001851 TaxID=3154529 RepID=UPI00333422B6
MGILTLLRNAFGRSRKARAEAEGADRLPAQQPAPTSQSPEPHEPTPTVPEPRRSAPDEHDLVAAAFDNLQVPHPSEPTDPEPETPAEKRPTEAGAAPEQGEKTEEKAEEKAAAQEKTEEKAEAEAPLQEPTEAKAPVQEPTEPETPVQETAEAKAPVQEPTEPEAPVQETTEAKAPVQEPAEPEAPVQETAAGSITEPKTEERAEPETPAEETPGAEDEAGPQAGQLTEDSGEPKAEEQAETEQPLTEQAEAEQQAEPEAEGGTRPEAEKQAETEQPLTEQAEAEQQAEPEDQAEPEAESGTRPEAEGGSQAADGEDAPQGPPAADDESSTGGAGGNPDAEGEAEAEGTHAAEAPERKTPATPLTKVKSRTPSLATAYKAAAATLKKTDLTGTRAKLYLVLDRSASMRPYYKDGSAQALADQTLALAAHLDPEATVHVVFFSTEVDGTTDLTLTPDHETRIDDVHAGLGRMGRTSYHAAVEAVLAHYDKHHESGTPALVVFQTDGAPDAKTPATQALTEAAQSHPAVFFSFVAFGDHDNKAFDYARRLKTGNTSFFHAGPAPRELTDTELYEGVLATWRP